MRLAPLFLCGALAACATTEPRSISGALPSSGSYSIVAGETVSPVAQAALARALGAHGLKPAEEGQRPDRLVLLTLADRPLASGSFAGDKPPADRKAPGWTDRPLKPIFGKNRREIRLTIRFLSPDGQVRDQRIATEIVTRKAPAADLPQLIAAALSS